MKKDNGSWSSIPAVRKLFTEQTLLGYPVKILQVSLNSDRYDIEKVKDRVSRYNQSSHLLFISIQEIENEADIIVHSKRSDIGISEIERILRVMKECEIPNNFA